MNTMKQIFAIILLAMAAWSCKKESPVGPDLKDLYGFFKINEPFSSNIDSVDFTKDSIQFKGSWSIITPWKITIKGKTSGALKVITGTSKTLDTLLGLWSGKADGIFFKKEICDITLSFEKQPDTVKKTLTISGLHDYSKDGILIYNYEKFISNWGPGKNTLMSNDTVPEGKSFFYMEGKELGNHLVPDTLINGVHVKDSIFGGYYYLVGFPGFTPSTGSTFDFGSKDSSQVYVNAFIRGYGYEGSKITFSFLEQDNDSYVLQVAAPISGWKKISFPLSKTILDSKKGNGFRDIDKITTIYISLFSSGVKADKIAAGIDYVIITKGKPL
jgi:hypothetical protein